MKILERIMIIVLVAFMLLFSYAVVQAQGKYNLKPGSRGKLCVSCHEDFATTMNKKFVHTPLKDGDCTGCHNPHAAEHGKLLASDPAQICYSCHDSMVPEGARSVHKVISDGCGDCHDPHASNSRNNLVKGGSALCFSCHEELGEKVSSNTFSHAPVKKDCMTCHTAHASKDNPSLLKSEPPKLCLKCHDPNRKTFKSQHVNYPVETANCSSCHDPHGSNQKSILYDNVHEPMDKRMCKQCHYEANSATPLATVKESFELCQGCHYDMVTDAFNNDRIHWPLVDGVGCLNCHSPHASSEPTLIKAPMKKVCGDCHEDTISRQDRALTRHQPIDEGECGVCHAPHSSNNRFLLEESSIVDLCGQCHDWQIHSTHPIGEEVVDPRNPNLQLDCLSCHRSHGTEYKHFIYNETINDLCVQCHTKYRR